MKLSLFVWVLAVLATTILAWEKEDHEIFDLVSSIEASEGKGTTFYSWLDVPSTATTGEIAKAYRKLSMQLHPDKNPNIKGIHERFARLGVVSTILRNKDSRKRYDFFYKNGVPRWRGTGYYYSRFRPGLGSVLGFLVFLTSGLQYIIQSINYKKDLQRIENITNKARVAAWGAKMVPTTGQRKVKVNLGTAQDEDGYGEPKWIDMVVEGQNVYLLEADGNMHLLDSSTATKPTIIDTWFFYSLKKIIFKIYKNNDKKAEEHAEPNVDIAEEDDASSTSASETPGSGTATPSENGKSARMPTSKAGGKRRKAVRKR